MPFFRQFIVYLMIAVFFNTAIGVPLHAAEHWRGGNGLVLGAARANGQAVVQAAAQAAVQPAAQAAVQPAAQAAVQFAAQAAAQSASPALSSSELAELSSLFAQEALPVLDVNGPDSRPDTHGVAESCAVCAAHNLQATAFVIWPTAPPVAPLSTTELPSYLSPAFAAAGQWPFAARDPPRA